jgi:hypothetical protein
MASRQIAKYQVTASGAKADEAFFPSNAGQRAQDRGRQHRVAHDTVARMNALLLSGVVDEVTIERIFNRSVALSSDAIVDFVTQLCNVSEQVRGGVWVCAVGRILVLHCCCIDDGDDILLLMMMMRWWWSS